MSNRDTFFKSSDYGPLMQVEKLYREKYKKLFNQYAILQGMLAEVHSKSVRHNDRVKELLEANNILVNKYRDKNNEVKSLENTLRNIKDYNTKLKIELYHDHFILNKSKEEGILEDSIPSRDHSFIKALLGIRDSLQQDINADIDILDLQHKIRERLNIQEDK